jgi:hypothetical protein
LRYDRLSLENLQRLRDELLDYVAARALDDPALTADEARKALRTAATCAHGVLALGVWPKGDWEIAFPIAYDETLSSNNFDLHSTRHWHQAPTLSTWGDAFALCLISTVFKEPWPVGAALRADYAPELRQQEAAPAALAEMDALCGYLVDLNAWDKHDAPTLRKPDAEERDRAARRLDESIWAPIDSLMGSPRGPSHIPGARTRPADGLHVPRQTRAARPTSAVSFPRIIRRDSLDGQASPRSAAGRVHGVRRQGARAAARPVHR